VKAAPTAAGTFTGALNVVTSYSTTPLTVSLGGTTLATSTTTTSLTASSSAPYSLTATVTGSRGASSPGGNVSFLDLSNNNISLGSAILGSSTSVFGINTYSPPPLGGFALNAITYGDFNNDGSIDIAVANGGCIGVTSCNGPVTVLLGKGDGTFTTTASNSLPYIESIAAGDFNSDGKLDLAVIANGKLLILLGKGDGTFTQQTNSPTTVSNPFFVMSGDLNGDGKTDLIYLAGAYVDILLSNGDGTFTAKSTPQLTASCTPASIALADFNNDGKLDIAASCIGFYMGTAGPSIDIFLATGTGGYTKSSTVTSPNGTSDFGSFASITAGDINADGKIDIVATLANDQSPYVSILPLLGNGDGTFTSKPPIATSDNQYLATVGAADFNHDGKADIAFVNDTHFSIYLSNGDGTFGTPYSVSGAISGPSFLTQTIADFNNDGLPDLAVADGDLNLVRLQLSSSTSTTTATLNNVSVPGTGSHNIGASYAGGSPFAASTSSPVSLAATRIATTLGISSSAGNSVFGQQIVLTATLNPYTSLGLSINGETVTFLNGTTSLGTGSLSSGVATLNTTTLPVGTASITASYAGDSNFAAAASSATSVVIAAAVPNAALSPSTLTFATQLMGTTSSPQVISLTNSGTAALTISSIAASGDFAQTNNCGTSLAAAASCSINVTFTPTTTGSRTGSIAVTDNASGSPQTIALSGSASGFSLSANAQSLTIASPGGSATTSLSFSSLAGFSGTVALTCSVSYQGTGTANDTPSCSLSPTSVSVSGTSSATSTLTVSTTAATSSSVAPRLFGNSGIALASLLVATLIPRRRRRMPLLLCLLSFAVLSVLAGCGGSSTPKDAGTTSGNYRVVVNAASGNATATSTVTVTLQ
jgi:hypothetical protein